MIRRLKAFGSFWYDFVIGDDWRAAAFVVAALAITATVAHYGAPAWWIVPAAVVVFLLLTLWRVVHPAKRRAD